MILSTKPLAFAEVKEYFKNSEDNKQLEEYLKKFSKLNKDKTEKLKQEISSLGNMKIKEEHIIKIADFLPQDIEDLNKIFNEASLTEEEANAILEIVKKY